MNENYMNEKEMNEKEMNGKKVGNLVERNKKQASVRKR